MTHDEIGAVEIIVRRAKEIILITPEHKAALGEEVIQVIADALEHYRKALAKECLPKGEIGELRAEIERLRTWLGDSEMTVSKLRAALEEIAKYDNFYAIPIY